MGIIYKRPFHIYTIQKSIKCRARSANNMIRTPHPFGVRRFAPHIF